MFLVVSFDINALARRSSRSNSLFKIIADICIIGEKQKEKEKERDRLGSASSVNSKNSATSEFSTASSVLSQPKPQPEPTWIHDIFEGTLTNETRCLCCETVSNVQCYCIIIAPSVC